MNDSRPDRARRLACAALVLAALCAPALEALAAARVALVIGNGAYEHAALLPNPGRDAAAVGNALERLGFAVIRVEDAGFDAMRRGFENFSRKASAAEVAVVFYAGHGIEVDGTNFLIPVDAALASDREVGFQTIPLDLVMLSVEGASRFGLVILDACRNNPFANRMRRAGATRAIGRGLAKVEPAGGALVAYAASAGMTADDGPGGRNSPYTSALLRFLEEPGLEVGMMFRKVSAAVKSATGGAQQPKYYGDLPEEPVYLSALQGVGKTGLPGPAGGAAPPPAGRVPGRTPGEVFRDCPQCPEMTVVPAGAFTMGSPPGEPLRYDNEGPAREVTLDAPFAIGRYEVTFAEWDACGACEHRPPDSGWGRDRRPVLGVSWRDAQRYIEWLSRAAGQDYRLASEAEWEYAARAGTAASRYWGAGAGRNLAHCTGCGAGAAAPRGTVPVGSFPPNRFGLYDMLGNVWEWTQDCWRPDYRGAPANGAPREDEACAARVLRGGAWSVEARLLRVAARLKAAENARVDSIGFRVARDLP